MTHYTQGPVIVKSAFPAAQRHRLDVVGVPIAAVSSTAWTYAQTPPKLLNSDFERIGSTASCLVDLQSHLLFQNDGVGAAQTTYASVPLEQALPHVRGLGPKFVLVDALVGTKGSASPRYLDAAHPTLGPPVRPPRELRGVDPTGRFADAASAHVKMASCDTFRSATNPPDRIHRRPGTCAPRSSREIVGPSGRTRRVRCSTAAQGTSFPRTRGLGQGTVASATE